jgi:hypothetical protein
VRHMQQHVHACDETPLGLNLIGNQTARLADVGNPESTVRVMLLNVLYRGSNQV